MKKKLRGNKISFWIAIMFVVLLVLVVLLSFPQLTFHNNFKSSEEMKSYSSKLLKITIDTPENYIIDEEFGIITLHNEGGNEIVVSRIGTNNDSLEGFLFDIAERNNLTMENKEKLTINNLPTIKVDINGERKYYIYSDYAVYIFETKSSELYPDLDQIAESFRYEP